MGQEALGPDADSFPKLLARNARERPDRPAYREKEYGVWQSWTWAEAAEEVGALARGLAALGLAPGDHLAIIGRNRPALYWSMVAAQCCGAVPVPLYQDAVAEEMAYVLDHCGARYAVVADQEQVDKLLEIRDRLPALRHVVYLDPRGLRNYDHDHLHRLSDVQAQGRAASAAVTAGMDARIAAQGASDTCVMLYTSGTTGRPKGVVLSNANIILTARASCAFDALSDADSVLAYLPMAWVGDFIFSMGQAFWAGFCVNCPESPETMQADLREIGPSYFFAPPRFFEGLLTSVTIRMEDASALKRRLYAAFMDLARRGRPRHPRRPPGRGLRPRALQARRGAGLRAAEERAGAEPGAGRLHRRRGDRAGALRLLPGARDQPQAALRPDRGERLHHPAARPRGPRRHGGHAEPRGGAAHRRDRRGLLPLPGRVPRVLPQPREHRRDQGRRGLGRDRGRRLRRRRHRAPADHRPGQGRRQDRGRQPLRAEVHGEQAEVLSPTSWRPWCSATARRSARPSSTST